MRGANGGYAPRIPGILLALSFFRFDGESQSSQLPRTLTVSPQERHCAAKLTDMLEAAGLSF